MNKDIAQAKPPAKDHFHIKRHCDHSCILTHIVCCSMLVSIDMSKLSQNHSIQNQTFLWCNQGVVLAFYSVAGLH